MTTGLDFRNARRIALATLLIALFIAITGRPLHAATWNDVTVVTSTGWEYRGMTVEPTADSTGLVMQMPDGAQKRLSLANVRLILDARGRDITAQVLAGHAPPPAADVSTPGAPPATGPGGTIQPEGQPDRRASSIGGTRTGGRYRGARYRLALSGSVGYGWSTGDWFSGLGSGATVDGTARLAVADNIYLGFRYLRQNLSIEDRSLLYPGVDVSMHLNEYYGVLGYMTETSFVRQPIVLLECGLGSVAHKFEASNDAGAEASSSMSKFGLYLAGAAIFPISQAAGFQLDMSFRMTGSGTTSTYGYSYQSSSGELFGISAGLVVLLGH